MVICLERGADLHMAQLMPLPLTVSCSSKIQIGFTFLVPAHPGRPGQRAVKRVYVGPYVWESPTSGADPGVTRVTSHTHLAWQPILCFHACDLSYFDVVLCPSSGQILATPLHQEVTVSYYTDLTIANDR